MMQLEKATKWCLITFCILGLIHIVFVLIYIFAEDDFDLKRGKKGGEHALGVILQVIFIAAESVAFLLTFVMIKRTLAVMIKFHDYLIQYRLTPRSRILRKHLPKMAMVLEEESNMDTSSMMHSQSRIMSVSMHLS